MCIFYFNLYRHIIFFFFHLFNLNIGMDNNFHIRDVGSPTALWTIPAGEKVVVDFNATWHPIGTSGLKFSQLGVKYIQSGKFVGLNAPNWRKIPSQAKEDLWAALMVCKASYLQIYCMEHI